MDCRQPNRVFGLSPRRARRLNNFILGDDLVIAKIKESQPDFSLGTEDLIILKKANVSDVVISEMMNSMKKGKRLIRESNGLST